MTINDLELISEKEGVKLYKILEGFIFVATVPWTKNLFTVSFDNRENAIPAIDALIDNMTNSTRINCLLLLDKVQS